MVPARVSAVSTSGEGILPYRPPLPTAKAIATVQELSGGRLLLGVGVGWMKPEFRALGVPRAPISLTRVAGVALVIAGVVLVRRG